MPDMKVDKVAEYKIVEFIGNTDYWKGDVAERIAKFEKLNKFLNGLFKQEVELVVNVPKDINKWVSSMDSYAERVHKEFEETEQQPMFRICLNNKLSLITYLSQYGSILQLHKPQAFAISIFRKAFPNKFKNLMHIGEHYIARSDYMKQVVEDAKRKMIKSQALPLRIAWGDEEDEERNEDEDEERDEDES